MVSGQRNEMVEDAGFARSIPLELLDQLISFLSERRLVHLRGHEASWRGSGVWVSAQVLAIRLPLAVDLLSERERRVKRRGIVVVQFRIWYVLTHFIHHAGDLRDIGLFRFDPKRSAPCFKLVTQSSTTRSNPVSLRNAYRPLSSLSGLTRFPCW